MKVITIEELEKLAPGEATIVDVRPEEELWSFSACLAMMQEMWKGGTVHSCAFSWEDLFPKKTS